MKSSMTEGEKSALKFAVANETFALIDRIIDVCQASHIEPKEAVGRIKSILYLAGRICLIIEDREDQ